MKNEMIKGINKAFFYINNYTCVPYERECAEYVTLPDGCVEYRTVKKTEYVPEVLAKADLTCRDHIIGKWLGDVNERNNGTHSMLWLYGELDSTNRIAVLKWICENYDDEQHLNI